MGDTASEKAVQNEIRELFIHGIRIKRAVIFITISFKCVKVEFYKKVNKFFNYLLKMITVINIMLHF
jgi:hypothetical protein